MSTSSTPPTNSSFTVMNPQYTADRAYSEFVIKAVELIGQTRQGDGQAGDATNAQLDTRMSPRQFAMVFPENFNARGKILIKPKRFFEDRTLVVVDFVLYPKSAHSVPSADGVDIVAERWEIQFDSPKDVMPTTRSERRDHTLPRRLAIALRSLLSLSLFIDPIDTGASRSGGGYRLRTEIYERAENDLTDVQGNIACLSRTEVCCIPSSFGNLYIRVLTGHKITATPPEVRSGQIDRTPIAPRMPIRLNESFVQSHSLGRVEMVMRVDPPVVARSCPSSSSDALSKSPPRDISEIWPTSHLSYPSSPSQRKASFDRSCVDSCVDEPLFCVSRIPLLKSLSANTSSSSTEKEELRALLELARLERSYCESPVSVTYITDYIDRLSTSHQKLISR